MRWELGNELTAFLNSFAEGAILALVFDLFRMARCPFRWKVWEVAVGDLCYFACAGWLAFLFLLKSSDGVIRFYILFGWLVGWILWYETAGRLLLFLWGKLCKAGVCLLRRLQKKAVQRREMHRKKQAGRREKRAAVHRLRAQKRAERAAKRRALQNQNPGKTEKTGANGSKTGKRREKRCI